MNSDHSELHSPVTWQRAILRILATHFGVLMFVIFVLCFIVPKFVKSLADMGAELPAATMLVISLANIAVDYWYLVLLVGVNADVAIVGLLASLDTSQRRLLTAYSRLYLLATIIFLVSVALALCIPMIGMNEAM